MREPRRGSARVAAVAAAIVVRIDIFDWKEKNCCAYRMGSCGVCGLGVHGLVGIFCTFGVGVGMGMNVSEPGRLLARVRQHVDAHDAALVLAAPVVLLLLRGGIDRLGAVREQLVGAN